MEKVEVNLNEIAIKAKSKGELYRVLVTEGRMYLMPQRECGLAFISEVCLGRKKVFFNDEIKICQVPHLKGLRTSHILDFIVKKCKAERYLPSNCYIYPPNRTWLCNIAYTLESEGFEALIKSLMKEREEHMLEKSNLTIKMDPKIAKIFENSQNVSFEKGKSHKLLRKAILNDQRKVRQLGEEELKDAASLVPELKREIDELVGELDSKNEKIEEYERQAKMLSNLFELGVIDGEGNLIKKEESQDMN